MPQSVKRDISNITIQGNIGNVRDIREVKDRAVLNFSVAVNDGVPGDLANQHSTWYNVAQWVDKSAKASLETLQARLTKGLKVTINGAFSTREYVTADGATRLNLNVFANRILLPATEEDADAEDFGAVPA